MDSDLLMTLNRHNSPLRRPERLQSHQSFGIVLVEDARDVSNYTKPPSFDHSYTQFEVDHFSLSNKRDGSNGPCVREFNNKIWNNM